jgi:predicted GNAT family acetyltransferase
VTWTFTGSLEEFRQAAEPLLRTRPVANTVALTILAGLGADGMAGYDDVLFGWWTDAATAGPAPRTSGTPAPRTSGTPVRPDREPAPACAAVRGAVIHTLPFNLLLAEVPDAAVDSLAAALYARGHTLPGAGGPPEVTRRFAAAWCARTNGGARIEREERLHALDRLVPPYPMPPGAPRVAGAADRDLLVRWMDGFDADVGVGVDNTLFVTERLAHGGLTLWERAPGEPVSMAGVTRPGAGVVRVGPVYTPGAYRQQGYARAVTAAVSRAALEAGAAGVVLYTDLSNPATNAMYPAIGYRPVEDRLVVAFSEPARPARPRA